MSGIDGRPPIIFKEQEVERLKLICGFPLTQESIALIMNCSVRTIDRFIQENFGSTFAEYCDKRREHLKSNILAKQYEMAMKGDRVMLIWLGKNMCGQADEMNVNKPRENETVTYRIGWTTEDGQFRDIIDIKGNNGNTPRLTAPDTATRDDEPKQG